MAERQDPLDGDPYCLLVHNRPLEKEAFVRYNTKLFRKVAPYYDWLEILISSIRRDFVQFVAPPLNAHILDVATGTGRQAFAFAAKGFETYGVDLSPHMLAIARRNNRFPNARFEIADGTALPFDDSSFDIVTMSFALHCMPLQIRSETIEELRRVTKRQGNIAFVDYNLPPDGWRRNTLLTLVRLYETPLWEEFIRSDFEKLLAQKGLVIERQHHFFLGAMRMVLCSLK
jgi:ubiquinone/menaquinone biosynthesis C-methylase UbiE